jgi:hypothetical protein
LPNIEHEIASVANEIIRLETKVTQQRARIQSLELCGGDTKLSYLLLRNFEDYLAHYYDRRGQLLGQAGRRFPPPQCDLTRERAIAAAPAMQTIRRPSTM